MGKRNRVDFFGDRFWQSSAFNQRVYAKNLDICLALAMNRFRWVNLPETCDARYLEWQLHTKGYATICYDESVVPNPRAFACGDIHGSPSGKKAVAGSRGADVKTRRTACMGETPAAHIQDTRSASAKVRYVVVARAQGPAFLEIGRASCRERV